MNAEETVSAKSLDELINDVVRVIDELRGWTPPINAAEQPKLASAWEAALQMKHDLEDIRTKMSAGEQATAPVGEEVVKVEIVPWKLPTEIKDISAWVIQFKQCMFDDEIDPPVGCHVLYRGIPDQRKRVSVRHDEFKAFLDAMLHVASPRVEWNDNQIEMARDAIKTMKLDITTLRDSFIDRNDLHFLFRDDQF
jgi:hypothetical protein